MARRFRHKMRLLFSILFTTIFAAASFGAHWTIASWAMRVFPEMAKRRRWLIVAAVLLVAMTPLARLVARHSRTGLTSEAAAFAMFELMVVVFSVLPLLLARLLSRFVPRPRELPVEPAQLVPALAALDPTPQKQAVPNRAVGRRELIERVGGIAALGLTGSAFGWGMVRGRHAFEIDEVVVKIVGLPRALEGYTIAQVSDIHTGVFVQERELAEGLGRIKEFSPDLVVATGDLVDFDPHWAPLLARSLADVNARDGVVAVIGNHDYYTGIDAVLGALREARVEVLLNEGRRIRPDDGGGFALLGVDDLSARRSGGVGPRLDAAIAMVPPDVPRILLAHQPQYLAHSAGKVALQLSGHTHGGQINPGFRPTKFVLPYISGRYERNGTTLWVNRGFGVAGPPARIGAPPEVTKIILVAG